MPRKKSDDEKSSLEGRILDNIVQLQKIETRLAEKFDRLSSQIGELLHLFEMSARAFAQQPHIQMAEKDKEFLEKIDKLLEQNKTIAKGLTLMEEKMREKIYGGPVQQQAQQQEQPRTSIGRPLPKF